MIIEESTSKKTYTIMVDSDEPEVIEYARKELKRKIRYEEEYKPRFEDWKKRLEIAKKKLDDAKEHALNTVDVVMRPSEVLAVKEFNVREVIINKGDFSVMQGLLPPIIIDMMQYIRARIDMTTLADYWDAQEKYIAINKEYPKFDRGDKESE